MISIEPKAPILFPKSPERIVPIKGKIIINKYILNKEFFYKVSFLLNYSPFFLVFPLECVLCPRTGNLDLCLNPRTQLILI